MSLWAEQSDDDDFFSEKSFHAFKKEHDEEMRKLLQFIQDNKAKHATTITETKTEPLRPLSDEPTPPTEPRFTKVTKKKQWKHHTPLNK